MEYLYGGLVGLVFGAIMGLLKHFLCWGKSTDFNKRVHTYMGLGALLNIISLLAVFFLRDFLPWPWEGVLLGTALGLSAVSQLLSLRMAKKNIQQAAGTKAAPAENISPTEESPKQ